MGPAARWSAKEFIGALVLAFVFAALTPRCSRAEVTQDQLVSALFDAELATAEFDLNDDDAVSVADLVSLSIPPGTPVPTHTVDPNAPTPTHTRRPPPSSTPTTPRSPSATRTGTQTATRTQTATTTASATLPPTVTRTATITATPTDTMTAGPTATQTPEGLIFDGDVHDVIPHNPGDTLTYRVTSIGQGVTMETATVISSDASGFVVDVVRGTVHERQSYVDTGGTLLYVSVLDVVHNVRTTCNPRIVRLLAPMHVGDMASTSSTCETRLVSSGQFLGSISFVETFMPVEIVPSFTVPAGTYSNLIRVKQTRTAGMEVNDALLVPGIGIVWRSIETLASSRLYELLDGTVNGHSVKP
jgi:hypothetical protein